MQISPQHTHENTNVSCIQIAFSIYLFAFCSYDFFIWCCVVTNGKITSLFCLFIFLFFTQIIKQEVINAAILVLDETAIFFDSIFLLGIFLKLHFLYTCEKNAKHKPFWIIFSKPFLSSLLFSSAWFSIYLFKMSCPKLNPISPAVEARALLSRAEGLLYWFDTCCYC